MLCVGQECVQKKKKFKKLLSIAAFFKTRLQENQRSGPWAAFLYKNTAKTFFKTRLQENQRSGPWAALLYKNAAKTRSIAVFLYKNAAIDLSLCVVETKGWELQPRVIKMRLQALFGLHFSKKSSYRFELTGCKNKGRHLQLRFCKKRNYRPDLGGV